MTDDIKTQEPKKRGRKPKSTPTTHPEASVIASEQLTEELNTDVDGSEKRVVESNTESLVVLQAEHYQDITSTNVTEEGMVTLTIKREKIDVEGTLSEMGGALERVQDIAKDFDDKLEEPQEPEVIEEVVEDHVTVMLKHVRLNPLIEEVLYIASLGGKLTPKKYPQLKRVPFTICMDIPKEKYQIYLDTEDRLEYSELEDYNEVVVRNPDPIKFLQLLIDTSKRGSVLAPKKLVTNTDMFKACVLTTAPVESKPNVSVSAKKRIYSLEELHKMKMTDLKVIAKWWGVEKAGNTVTMIKRIREAQDVWISRGAPL